MSARIEKPSVARHLQIFEEDWEFLDINFGLRSAHPIGISKAIRNIVHSRVKALRAKQIASIDEASPSEARNDTEISFRLGE
jgi:hypothetical protein